MINHNIDVKNKIEEYKNKKIQAPYRHDQRHRSAYVNNHTNTVRKT